MTGREPQSKAPAPSPPTSATRGAPAGRAPAGSVHDDLLRLQRTAGNAAVVGILKNQPQPPPAVRRLVDETKALDRVTKSEFKDLKARLEAGGGTGMATLYTGQFIRLASLFRKNRTSLNMLKSDPLEHLATREYETQDNFAATNLHDEVKDLPVDTQKDLIDKAVPTEDLLQSLAGLSVQSKKHIAVPKHEWRLVVASPASFQPSDERADAVLDEPSWQQVATVMGATINQGRTTVYKSTYQRLHDVNGQQVAVTYAVVAGKARVSDAWVVTR